MDEYLTQLYYNPKRSGSFGGVERLYRDVKKEGKYDISRAQLKKWLMKQDTYTLHKPARRHYKRNRVIVGGIDELWQMDLADMQSHAKENTRSCTLGNFRRALIIDFSCVQALVFLRIINSKYLELSN